MGNMSVASAATVASLFAGLSGPALGQELTIPDEKRAALSREFQALAGEIERITTTTDFGPLLLIPYEISFLASVTYTDPDKWDEYFSKNQLVFSATEKAPYSEEDPQTRREPMVWTTAFPESEFSRTALPPVLMHHIFQDVAPEHYEILSRRVVFHQTSLRATASALYWLSPDDKSGARSALTISSAQTQEDPEFLALPEAIREQLAMTIMLAPRMPRQLMSPFGSSAYSFEVEQLVADSSSTSMWTGAAIVGTVALGGAVIYGLRRRALRAKLDDAADS